MQFFGRTFRFRWALTCGALLLSAILASFGFWQLQRAEEKKILQADIDKQTSANAIQLTQSLADNWQKHRFQKVFLTGFFETDNQRLMDNRVVNGKAGYHVITPFRVSGSDLRILINRGWVSTGNDRTILPEIFTPASEIELAGRISPPRSRPPMLSEDIKPDQYSDKVWTHLDIDYFTKKFNTKVEPYIVLAENDLKDQLIREWPRFDAKMAMHIGYAVQWFAFSFFALILWLGASFTKNTEIKKVE